MRRVSHRALSERGAERGAERRPPAPRWRRRLGRAALALVALAGLGAAGRLALDAGLPAAAGAAGLAGLERGTAALGLRVEEALAEGRNRTSQEAVAGILRPYVGRSALLVDLEAIRAELQGLPWVRSASVARLLPDTLLVRLEEHEAVALWHDGRRTLLVGVDGSLLPVSDLRAFSSLKLLHGEGAPAAAAELLEVLGTAPELARRVTAASRVAGRRWNLYLDGRVEVRLPERRPLEAWRRLVELERDGQLTARSLEAVDFRNAAWTAIRLKGEPKDLILGRGA